MNRPFALACLAASCLSAMAQTTEAPPPVTQQAPVNAPGTTLPSMSATAVPTDATQSPYYIGVQQSFTHESNIGFAPAGSDKVADTYSTTALRGGINRSISRQRFYADGEARMTRYDKSKALNNNGYSVRAGWDWATIERLSGSVNYNADRSLTRLATYVPAATAIDALNNIETSQELSAVARLGGVTALTFEVGSAYRVVHYSNEQLYNLEYDRTAIHGAVLYRVSPALTLGVGALGAKYDYHADEAQRHEGYLTAQWTPNAVTDVQARLAATRMRYDYMTAQDFSGVTGSLVWSWRPSGRSAVVTYLTRDTGQDQGFLQLVPGQGVAAADFARVTDTVGVRGTYEVTAKVLADGGLSWQRRDIGNLYTGTSTTRRETTTTGSLGARWLVTRSATLGCQISRQQRDTSIGLNTTTGYKTGAHDDIIGCFGAFTLY